MVISKELSSGVDINFTSVSFTLGSKFDIVVLISDFIGSTKLDVAS